MRGPQAVASRDGQTENRSNAAGRNEPTHRAIDMTAYVSHGSRPRLPTRDECRKHA
ncbi:hypothetical protein BSIN_3274 [Burkholderia singularis]|uniref:Uncharacterized protein n=1 Tax=Burkholderia singularis TaxID=1503053 RepID=A0A238H495_9BURK|nr:hypothetical protein BSIN_3274 [Burkholderia singularis]